jgi:ribose-phosphate pyrophosphokinase
MIVFYTTSTNHLRSGIDLPQGISTITQFSSGELNVRIEPPTDTNNVWLICATATASDFMELFLTLDALSGANIKINLLFTYFGYARNDRSINGQAISSAAIARLLQSYPINHIAIVHPHSARLTTYLAFIKIIPTALFKPLIETADILVAPDRGALPYLTELGTLYKKPVAFFEKIRHGDTIENLTLHGNVAGKKVLIIDDMIDTAQTITKAAALLHKAGAHTITAAATHGIFSGEARTLIEQSPISSVFVTNSLEQKPSDKVHVLSVETEITRFLKNF